MQYMRAFYGFERPNMRSLVSDPQARISKGLVFRKAQASLTNSRLAGQFNRTLSNSGFFCAYRMPYSDDTTARKSALQIERMQSCGCRGRGAKSQIAPDERSKKGHTCRLQGLHGRAVADTDLSDRSMNRITGIGYGTGLQVGDDP